MCYLACVRREALPRFRYLSSLSGRRLNLDDPAAASLLEPVIPTILFFSFQYDDRHSGCDLLIVARRSS